MEQFRITGGTPLKGELPISGAKNSVLPLLASTVLFRKGAIIHGCPKISDVDAAIDILNALGCRVRRIGDSIYVSSESLTRNTITENQMKSMRSSILFLGPLLARTGSCTFCQPGGCCLGDRPIDLHIAGLRKMGADLCDDNGGLICCGKLKGKTIVLPFPSVGATENLVMAALGAQGTTTLCNVAKEPEIGDLIRFLNLGGAHISGGGTSVLQIQGGFPDFCEYRVMPDRMEAATYLAAAVATSGNVLLKDIDPCLLAPVLLKYRQAGCELRLERDKIYLKAPGRVGSCGLIRTAPYPGFPTDAQAPVMASLLKSDGVTVFDETVFTSRYRHVPALLEMGGDIKVGSSLAFLTGCERIKGARMTATDLRGGAAMVVAALGAEGTSLIDGVCHLHRGYGNMVEKLRSLGGNIDSVQEEAAVGCEEGKDYG